MAAVNSVGDGALRPEERARNALGEILVFRHNEGSAETDYCTSTMPKVRGHGCGVVQLRQGIDVDRVNHRDGRLSIA